MPIKVLIVDDLKINLRLLRLSLQAEGMEVLEAENGREALEVLSRKAADCVVTDILMPEMDGYRLCQEIRGSPKLDRLPIIVYTATYISPGEERLALDAGADVYLRKPAPAAVMCAAIRRLAGLKSKKRKKPSEPNVVLRQYSEVLIKKLEEKNLQLQQEQEKFRQITDTIQEVFWMTNLDFTAMLYISPVYETIWGRSCESLYRSPQDWLEAVHPEDRERAKKAVVERMGKEPYEIEYRIVRPDDGMRWIKVRSFPIKDEEGRVYRVTGTATDVTEQKRLLTQFQQAQKMEAVGRLAGGVAHDFNNLLTVIMGLSEINLEAMPPEHPLRADLEDIMSTAERAAQLTQQLLAFSRRQVFEPRMEDLSELVTGAERLLQRVIGEDVQMTSKLAPALRPVFVDPNQLGQVLVNLCVNARDAMAKGGMITIETADVSLKEDLIRAHFTVPKGEYATLRISDTGEGMSEEVKAHLFEPFFTTKAPGKGTGLGLATCCGIIEQSKGFIVVESALGKGASFTVYLPVAEKEAGAGRRPDGRSAPAARGRETILMVEDEAPLRGLVCRILRARGYTVLEGTNGEEGLKIAEADKQKSIRLVLTDVVMPVMNGMKLSQELKRSRPDIKVLFASGYPDETICHQGVLDKGVAFLRKPFTPDSLTRKVREVLDAS